VSVDDYGYIVLGEKTVLRELPSNEVANGDVNEDRELEDERDGNDWVVSDTGFASRSSWAVQT
jgi:hypothetical protein